MQRDFQRRTHPTTAPPAKLKNVRKNDEAANAIDRPNTIWINFRNPPLVSPNARVSPVTMMMRTAGPDVPIIDVVVSLVIDTGLTAVGHYLEANFSGATTILRFLNNLVSFAVAAVLFAMIFKILPAVDITWNDVFMGALVTALLFTFGKFLIGYYLGKSNVASSYGAAASIITILLWIYYSSLILLFGAEFTKAYAESRGSLGPGHTAAS